MLEIKNAKLLGSGYSGNVYEVSRGNQKFIQKVYHTNKDNIRPDISEPAWCEIEFSRFTKKFPQYFMALHSFSFISDCNFKPIMPDGLIHDKKAFKKHTKRDSSSVCAVLLYQPVMKETVATIYDDLNNKYEKYYNADTKLVEKKEFYEIGLSILFQQLYILYLVIINGWLHGDAHMNNWMSEDNKKPIYMSGLGKKKYNINCPYRLRLVDYTGVKSQKLSGFKSDNEFFEKGLNDAVLCIAMNIYAPVVHDEYPGKTEIDFNQLYKKLKKYKLKIIFRHCTDEKLYRRVYCLLVLLKYPDIFYKCCGLADRTDIPHILIGRSKWEINTYEFLFNYYDVPFKSLDKLHKCIHEVGAIVKKIY